MKKENLLRTQTIQSSFGPRSVQGWSWTDLWCGDDGRSESERACEYDRLLLILHVKLKFRVCRICHVTCCMRAGCNDLPLALVLDHLPRQTTTTSTTTTTDAVQASVVVKVCFILLYLFSC